MHKSSTIGGCSSAVFNYILGYIQYELIVYINIGVYGYYWGLSTIGDYLHIGSS